MPEAGAIWIREGIFNGCKFNDYMTYEEIQELVEKDEHRCLELKKTTGELQDGMHSACAF